MILFLGVAGSGKSLQGRMLAESSSYQLVSTGDLFRKNLSEAELERMRRGRLYSDEETISVVSRELKDLSEDKELIFDGFPRTVAQAKWIMDQVKSGKWNLTAVFNLQASEEIIAKRLSDRGRFDDQEETIKVRLEEYRNKTKPVIDYFKKSGVKIIDIDANRTPEEIHREIESYLAEGN